MCNGSGILLKLTGLLLSGSLIACGQKGDLALPRGPESQGRATLPQSVMPAVLRPAVPASADPAPQPPSP